MKLCRHPGNKLFRPGELTVLGRNQRVRMLIEAAGEFEAKIEAKSPTQKSLAASELSQGS